MLFSVIFFGAYWSASAQVYIKVRPIVPVVVQTERPGPAHVWIGEEWNEDGHGGYRYGGGHWEAPPHPGDRWNQGHWNHDRDHGDNWVRGSWGRERR
jgi:hypothetical protein